MNIVLVAINANIYIQLAVYSLKAMQKNMQKWKYRNRNCRIYNKSDRGRST